MIKTDIYKAPFFTGAHTALQLLTTFCNDKMHKRHRHIEACRHNLLVTHTHKSVSCWEKVRFIDLEQIRKVGRTSGRYCTDAKRRSFVFDSRIDWKPVQSLKMKCNVVFQEERIFPGAFKMRGAVLF